MDTQKKPSTIILEQLGGRKFLAMTGSYNLIANKNSLSMKLRRNTSPSNYLRITLSLNDDYKMEFISFRGQSCKTKQTYEGICFDQLQEIFTDYTGLLTSL